MTTSTRWPELARPAEAALAGTPTADLPAYRFQAPCDRQLAGILPQLAHWNWRDPPLAGVVQPTTIPFDDGDDCDREAVA